MNGLNGQQYGRQVTGYNAGNSNNGNNYYYDNNGGYAQQSQSQHNTGQYATNYNQNTTSLNTGSSVSCMNGLFGGGGNGNNNNGQYVSFHSSHIYNNQCDDDEQMRKYQNKNEQNQQSMQGMNFVNNQNQNAQNSFFSSSILDNNGCNHANCCHHQRMCAPNNIPPPTPNNIQLPPFNLNGMNNMNQMNMNGNNSSFRIEHNPQNNNFNQFNMNNFNQMNMLNMPHLNCPNPHNNVSFNNTYHRNSCCSNGHCMNNNMNNTPNVSVNNNNFINATNNNLYFPVIATPAAPSMEINNFCNSQKIKNNQNKINQSANVSFPSLNEKRPENASNHNLIINNLNNINPIYSSSCSLTSSNGDLRMKQSPNAVLSQFGNHNSSPLIDLNLTSDASMNAMLPPPLQSVKESDSLNSSDTGTITPPHLSMPAIIIKTDKVIIKKSKNENDDDPTCQKGANGKNKQYQCGICNSHWFTTKEALERHTKTHEIMKSTTKKKSGDPNRPWQCEICKRSFAEKCTLKRHVRIHTNEKPWKCEYCSKAFNQSCSLQAHIRIHTGERPFPCVFCEKRFRQSTHRRQHMKRVHKEQWEKMQAQKKKK